MTLKGETGNQEIMRNETSRTDSSCMPMTAMDNLDNDILGEILTRLPAKTVAGLKVINKRWYSLICHPSFTNNHTSRQTCRNACSYFSYSSRGSTVIPISFDHSLPDLIGKTTISLGLPEEFKDAFTFIIASCHGLLLVLIKENICIFNPLTKKKQLIPSLPCIPNKPCPYKYGLVFGPTSSSPYYYNHYNVVCFVVAEEMISFKVFNPETGCWRDSKKTSRIVYGNGLSLESVSEVCTPVCFRRIIYWLTETGVIIAFNLDKEESWLIEVPKSVSEMESVINSPIRSRTWFGVIEDEINLVVVTPAYELVIWVLDDYENNKWKLKRKDVIRTELKADEDVDLRSIIFDGVRLVLFISIFHETGIWDCHWQEYNIETGITGPVCFTSTVGCFPHINTLTEVFCSN